MIRRAAVVVTLAAATAIPVGFALNSASAAATCDGKVATIVGTSSADRLVGTSGVDVIVGGAGNDVILGKAGNDIVCGGSGDDTISGNLGKDRIFGGLGADKIDDARGHEGVDRLFGGPGDDTVFGQTVGDVVYGGDGRDWIHLWGGEGHGGPGADGIGVAKGKAYGDSGNDKLEPYGDGVRLVGGTGADTLIFGGVDTGGARVDLAAGTGRSLTLPGATSGAFDFTFTGVENVDGTGYRDIVYGTAGANVLDGDGGRDTVYGRAGADACRAEVKYGCERLIP